MSPQIPTLNRGPLSSHRRCLVSVSVRISQVLKQQTIPDLRGLNQSRFISYSCQCLTWIVGALLHGFFIQGPSWRGLCHLQGHQPLQQREGKMENQAEGLKQFCPEMTNTTSADILWTIAKSGSERFLCAQRREERTPCIVDQHPCLLSSIPCSPSWVQK